MVILYSLSHCTWLSVLLDAEREFRECQSHYLWVSAIYEVLGRHLMTMLEDFDGLVGHILGSFGTKIFTSSASQALPQWLLFVVGQEVSVTSRKLYNLPCWPSNYRVTQLVYHLLVLPAGIPYPPENFQLFQHRHMKEVLHGMRWICLGSKRNHYNCMHHVISMLNKILLILKLLAPSATSR